jgi:hypothetical protein
VTIVVAARETKKPGKLAHTPSGAKHKTAPATK